VCVCVCVWQEVPPIFVLPADCSHSEGGPHTALSQSRSVSDSVPSLAAATGRMRNSLRMEEMLPDISPEATE